MPYHCGNHAYEKRIFGRMQLEDIINNMSPHHVIARYDCPCGYYSTYFTIHRKIMLLMLGAPILVSDELLQETLAYIRILTYLEEWNRLRGIRQNSYNTNEEDRNNDSEIER